MVAPRYESSTDSKGRVTEKMIEQKGTADLGSAQFRDFLSGSPRTYDPNALPGSGPRYRVFPTTDPNVMGWEVEVWDTRGGLNMTVGSEQSDWDRTADEDGVDARFYRTLILAQKTTTATSPDPANDLAGMHMTNIFGKLAIASGSTTNACLFSETSATDPTIVAHTYNSGSAITGLVPLVIGGITSARRLAILKAGGTIDLVSDLASTPTDVGTNFHANLNPTWGAIQTPLNSSTILFYANTRIYTLAASAAIGDSPTVALSNVPNGGFALGMLRRGGGPLRAYWVWPKQSSSTSMLTFGSEALGDIVSTNLEGVDPQSLDLGLKGIATAALVPDRLGIIATDGERVVFDDGNGPQDLFTFADRVADSDKELRIRGFAVVGPDVYYLVNQRAAPSGTGNTKAWWEYYDFDTGAIHKVTPTVTLSTTGSLGILPGGSFPFSFQNNFIHNYIDGGWRRFYGPPHGYNAYSLRKTDGAQSNSGTEFEASGSLTRPAMHLPGLEGYPKVVEECNFFGELPTGSSITIEVASQSTQTMTFAGNPQFTFYGRDRWDRHHARLPGNSDSFDRFQVKVTLTQGSDTRQTPQGLPIRIRGLAFLDGVVKPPKEVWGE